MKYEFEVYQMQVEDHLFWVARSKILKGCLGQGDTAEDAALMIYPHIRTGISTTMSAAGIEPIILPMLSLE